MPRRKARIDENQPSIVKHLRTLGMSVCLLHTVGQGVPDICVGYRGVNVLLEIKNPLKPKSDRQLSADEAEWHIHWRGQIAVVETKEQAEAEVTRCWERSVAR